MDEACSFDTSKGMRILERLGHKWEDNNKMDLKVVQQEGVGWIHLAQDMDKWGIL